MFDETEYTLLRIGRVTLTPPFGGIAIVVDRVIDRLAIAPLILGLEETVMLPPVMMAAVGATDSGVIDVVCS